MSSRIVNVSSLAHTRGTINIDDLNSEKSYNEGNAYSQSKLANVLFTRELAKRLEGTGVTVNALHPGVVDTELGRHMKILNNTFGRFVFIVDSQMLILQQIRHICSYVLRSLLWPLLKTPKSGAQTTLYAALDPELSNVTGKYFSDCAEKKVAPAATDDKMGQLLWEESEKWTHSKKLD